MFNTSTVGCAVVCTTEKPYISVNLPADLNDSINEKYTISVIYGPFYVSFSLLF